MFTLKRTHDLDLQCFVLSLYRGDKLIAAAPLTREAAAIVADELIERLPVGIYSDLGNIFFYNVTEEERDLWVDNDGMAHALFSQLANLPADRTLCYPAPEDLTPKTYPRTGNL